MKKHELASQLRQRQYQYGMVERSLIDALSDDQIIESYITCSGCGEKMINQQDLQAVILASFNADHFLEKLSHEH